MLSGKTTLIAHLGYPTEAFKAPLIYNPWFEKHGIDAPVNRKIYETILTMERAY